MRTAPESRKVAALITSVRDKILIPRPDFQRRSVWTRQDKIAFIDTILSGLPFPEIYVASGTVDTVTGATTEVLVDGQQRITTIYEYFRGVPPFSASRTIKKYADLSEDQKREFLSYDVAVRNLGYLAEGDLVEVFSRMNSTSYDLNEIERYNAVYLGEFKKYSEEIAQKTFFNEIGLFSATDIRRMKDLSYIASLTAAMMSNYANRDDEVENYLAEYNDEFERSVEMKGRVEAVIDLIAQLSFAKGSPAYRKADFYTLAVELDRQIFKKSMKLDVEKLRDNLSKFYAAVQAARGGEVDRDDVRSYFEATLQNTNDRSQRIIRGRVLEAILESIAQPRVVSEIAR
ncbi:hypothetical protein GGQ80_003547 [Sphingomonas jinjuensis]|uniref:GmrSD restriction endonucleases N-terminal domain-containing protein n=1 Tax=Sphingomonas jinjuensis TaxID=535907 RepID=A0A840FG31_9SPHN|nr:DUF262 domain-containing protein [Sphingomonas jinjuensis]MBB4155622.1 hypothetical protein [Sphingomonas jinjuensis]